MHGGEIVVLKMKIINLQKWFSVIQKLPREQAIGLSESPTVLKVTEFSKKLGLQLVFYVLSPNFICLKVKVLGCICTPLVISQVTVQQLEFLELQFKIIYLYINKLYPGSLHFSQILFDNICFIENTAYFHKSNCCSIFFENRKMRKLQ